MKNLLVTGASGYVGKNFISKYCDKYNIYSILRTQKFKKSKNSIILDLKNNTDYKKLPKNIHAIIHLAGVIDCDDENKLISYMKINSVSVFNLLEYALKHNIQNFIYASTGSLYKKKLSKNKETDSISVDNMYEKTKNLGEIILEEFLDKKNLNIKILRLFYPYGPGQENRLISNLYYKIKNNLEISLPAKNFPKINPVYIDDLVIIIDKFLKLKSSGIFNVCGDQVLSLEDIIRYIQKFTGKKAKIKYNGSMRFNILGNNRKLKNALKVDSDFFTSFAQGLEIMFKERLDNNE